MCCSAVPRQPPGPHADGFASPPLRLRAPPSLPCPRRRLLCLPVLPAPVPACAAGSAACARWLLCLPALPAPPAPLPARAAALPVCAFRWDSNFEQHEDTVTGGGGGVYSYSADTIEGPRAPAVTVKLTARHSSLTRVRAAGGGRGGGGGGHYGGRGPGGGGGKFIHWQG